MFVYRNGERTEYDGPRTAQGIVDHMREIADPNYKPPEEAVITLTEDNFDSTVESEALILVEFYAPWCGHCKRLKPEYERAARRLKQVESPIKLAKIDATVEKKLSERFEVKGYPTLLIFRNGKHFSYKGPREENGIVDYMKQMQQLPSKLVDYKALLKKQIQPDIPTIVGYFSHTTSPQYQLFIDVAYDQFDEQNAFVHVTNQELIQELKQKINTIVVYLPTLFRSKYETNYHSLELVSNTLSCKHFFTSKFFRWIQCRLKMWSSLSPLTVCRWLASVMAKPIPYMRTSTHWLSFIMM